ncbi:MAG: OmpA family protein [Bacteroides sp.]|nr:OmpA family protein [Bacteroides sp.]MCM1379318.1 OmpA family protein [Bacteroides sp.]MCM1445023.1 OmpA family protein [Prevotella sp.]
MKKTAIALAAAALMSVSTAMAVVPEITYVEDPAQGYTFNRFKDNWFIQAEGGVNLILGQTDKVAKFGDRIAPAFGIQAGKWFSPIMGFRGGLTYLGQKGASNHINNGWGNTYGLEMENGAYKTFEKDGKTYYPTHVGQLGVNFDAMLNITNWWCGYKPNRVYNFIAYVGGAAYFGFQHKFDKDGNNDGWDKDFDTSLALRGGIINSFNVSRQVALSLDIRYTAMSSNIEANHYNAMSNNIAAFIGVTYLFNQRTWTAPIVPVIPIIEDCDPYKARLAECEARLQDTQRKLDECLRRPMPQPIVQECVKDLATVYFPIGSATVSRTDRNVLKSVASIMKEDSKKYTVCGWADNYTGSDAVNARLRTKRAENVKKILVANGANADQLDVTTNAANRVEGKANVYLDRCVTITPAK